MRWMCLEVDEGPSVLVTQGPSSQNTSTAHLLIFISAKFSCKHDSMKTLRALTATPRGEAAHYSRQEANDRDWFDHSPMIITIIIWSQNLFLSFKTSSTASPVSYQPSMIFPLDLDHDQIPNQTLTTEAADKKTLTWTFLYMLWRQQ